jgi:fructokinase
MYGHITTTPKAGWADADVLSPFRCLGVPLGFSTDVNTAAFGEITLGQHGADVTSAVYVTIGTGIGCGVVVDGRVLTGLLHPEGGHIPVRRHPLDPASKFKGLCPFHADCLEGVATANAIAARLGIPITQLASLPDSHPVWEIQAYYLAQLCATISLMLSPHVIILGGGVMKRRVLYNLTRTATLKLLNGYLRSERIVATPERYIVGSRFDAEGSNTSAGAVGTLAFAKYTWEKQQQKQQQQQANKTNASKL